MKHGDKATMTIADLADELNISLVSAYSLSKKDGFPAIRVGGRILVDTEGFRNWLKKEAK